MLRIGTLVKDFPSRSKYSLPLAALSIRAVAKEIIAKECDDLPAEILKQIRPSTFKNGALVIVAPRLARVELQMRADKLKGAINRELGKRLITNLIFRTASF